jgi:predicted transcriptional regulator
MAELKTHPDKDMVVSGEEAVNVADALTATTMRMLQLLWNEPLDVSTIGRKLKLSQAYISEQVKLLEGMGLLRVSYVPGKRGVRKVCSPSVEKVTLMVKP